MPLKISSTNAPKAPLKPRQQRRKAPSNPPHCGQSDNAADPTQSPLIKIAIALRAQRLNAGWTVAQAAAWCGVGTRFLVDLEMGKPNIQIDKAFQVMARFGVSLAITSHPATSGPSSPSWVELTAPAGCKHPAAWLALCHAGLHIASHFDLPTLTCEPIHSPSPGATLIGLRVQTGAWTTFGAQPLAAALTNSPLSKPNPWCDPRVNLWHQDQGGPAIPLALSYLQTHSAMPINDIAVLLKWIVLSNALLDTSHHLGRLRIAPVPACGKLIRFAPLGEVLCCSHLFENTPHRGLAIANAWPGQQLRATEWKKLADSAGVHPKVIFHMMRDISTRVPGLLEQALTLSLGPLPTQGILVEAIKSIRQATQRMGDLSLAATRHTAGLATKQQPKLTPVPTRILIAPVNRFISVTDDE